MMGNGNHVLAAIAHGAMVRSGIGAGPEPRSVHHGPGRRTLYTLHKDIRANRYRPHQGARECARRRRQMGQNGQAEVA